MNAINHLILKYGTDEHKAAIEIFREIGCNDNVVRLIDNLEWIYLPRLIKENDWESIVLIYADMRIGPRGIISLKERLSELKARAPFEGIDVVISLIDKIEQIIQERTSAKLNSIRNEDMSANFEELLVKEVNVSDTMI